VQRKFRAGGTSGSIFSLIAATLGSGTISFPFAIQQNGILLGIILILLGASISYYTGMLLVKVSNRTQCNRYEDFAFKLYGHRCRQITSGLNLACLIGFGISYIVYVKSMLPEILLKFWTVDELPAFIVSDEWGQIFWATLFSFGMLLPMSLPRSINALRYSSLFGVLCSVYLSLAVFFVFYCDKEMVPDPAQNFKDAELFTLSFTGVVSSFPFIIFAYMYQVNIPMIYTELERRNAKQMSKVLIFGTVGAVVLYIIVGVWGYVTFTNNPTVTAEEALKDANILQAPYPNSVTPILIGNFALFFAIATAAPLIILPAKDTVEEIVAKGNPERRLSPKENMLTTFLLVLTSYLLACVIPSISDAMTLVGSTTNPAVGFILPIIFYWKAIEPDNVPICSLTKMTAIGVASFIIVISLLSLYNFFSTL
jgi:amino acid permease